MNKLLRDRISGTYRDARGRIRYALAGDGPWVIFCHALGTSLALWEAQVRALNSGWRTLSFDIRGHGDSDVARDGDYSFPSLAADIVALMNHVGASSASVVGISVGGEIAQVLAALYPSRVSRLLLTNTACVTSAERATLWSQRIAEAENSGMASIASSAARRWFTSEFQASHADTVAAWEQVVASTPVEAYVSIARVIRAMDLRPKLGLIKCKTQVLAGDCDTATGLVPAREIANGIGGAQLRVILGAGHLWNLEMPDKFNSELLSWLNNY
jgi:3-oxoadipate enol-lactonase